MQKIQILFPDPAIKALRRFSQLEDRPVSELVRRAVDRDLEQRSGLLQRGSAKPGAFPTFDGGQVLVSAPKMKSLLNGQFTFFSQVSDNLLRNLLTLEAMKLLRMVISLACLMATVIANAGEQLAAKAKPVVSQATQAELQLLQGTWDGVTVGDQPPQKVTITITTHSLHFYRDTNFWFETTLSRPAGTDPKQLHATIKRCAPSQADSIGKVVVAIYKVEDGKLTLVALGGGEEDPPKSLEAAEEKGLARYELRKVPPLQESIRPPRTQ